MTEQNIHIEIESERTIGDRENSESKQEAANWDTLLAHEPIQENSSFLEKYCASNPGASQCRIYDV